MAVRLEQHQRRYVGLSTDAKPLAELSAGSTFFETDTKSLFVFDGQTWTDKAAVSHTDVLLAGILEEAHETNDLLKIVIEKL